jgi:hypothetical protein
MEVSPDRDEDYCAEALNFHLGLLEAYSNRPDDMADAIQRSRTMPAPDDQLLFSDHVTSSMLAHQRQFSAIARKIPAILIACMPRSASATLTHTLAKLLNVPVLHICIGFFPDYFFAPSWLDMFLEGGAVTQDHFMLNAFNLGVIASRGHRHVFVTVRDPRAAARSQVHWLSREHSSFSGSTDERIRQECIENFIPWLQGWIDRSRDESLPFQVHMIKFQDVVRDLAGSIRRIATILRDEFPAMAPFCEYTEVEEVRLHFDQGNDEAWRSEVSEATRAELWNACTPDIRHLLNLAP